MKNQYLIFKIIPLAIILLLTACTSQKNNFTNKDEQAEQKIIFDLNILNEQGLYGPPDGLRILDYKFCIPKNEKYKIEIASIDSTIKFYDGTGFNNCSKEEILCIGNTHQKNFRQVLIKLASLNYIKIIEQMNWEE